MSTAPLVHCPQCGKSSVYSKTNPHRPFCSERCKLIDLGAWANENYHVPGPEVPDSSDEQPGADPGQ